MNATFTTALRYLVTATCVSPLRTGGTEPDLQQILRYQDGTPFLQGTSLAGAMNAWKPDKTLFGDLGYSSPLAISDVMFSGLENIVRPRLAIDPVRGTAAARAKFDMAALPVGTVGTFRLTWTGHVEPEVAAAQIEQYLQAMDCGAITLGAQKSNGYGRVKLQVQRRTYRLTDAGDRKAWLRGEQITDWQTISLSRTVDEDVVFQVTAKVDNLLVKDGTGEGTGAAGIKARQMRQGKQPIVPGSAIKGVLRGQIKRIVPHFAGVDPSVVDNFLGRPPMNKDNGVAGKARFSDGIIENAKVTVASRNRVDYFTGGTIDRALFAEETVAGTLSFDIRSKKEESAGLGLLLFALRDLGLGLCELGSGTNIGRGRINDLQIEIHCANQSARLSCMDGVVSVTDTDGLIAGWTGALQKGES